MGVIAATISNVALILSGLFAVGAVSMIAWALRLQKRQYPVKPLVTEPEERKRELRWYGFIYGGGHG